MKVSFEGICSGDYECFCWAVDKETFIRIKDHEPDQFDVNKFIRDDAHDEPLYNIYPDDVIGKDEGRKQSFIIEVEE